MPKSTLTDAGTVVRPALPSRYLDDADVQLMLRVRDGDDEAFGALVEAYRVRLVALFDHLLRGQDSSEDLAQEVLLRVYSARRTYRPTAKFTTWLFTIANNVARNSRRSRIRRRETPLPVFPSVRPGLRPAERLLTEESGMLPPRRLDRSELRSVVRAAVDSLDERQRTAVCLQKFEGLSYDDIGQAMRLSPVAIKSLLSRARTALRVKLAAYVSS